MVRYLTPSSPQARTIFLVALVPSLWPMTRGSMRFLAQRPLPSMIIAMCWGVSGIRDSDGKDVLFLLGDQLVHVGDVLVGQGLDLVQLALEGVLAQVLVLGGLLDAIVLVATDVADGDLALFADLAGLLGQLLAAVAGQDRHVEPD